MTRLKPIEYREYAELLEKKPAIRQAVEIEQKAKIEAAVSDATGAVIEAVKIFGGDSLAEQIAKVVQSGMNAKQIAAMKPFISQQKKEFRAEREEKICLEMLAALQAAHGGPVPMNGPMPGRGESSNPLVAEIERKEARAKAAKIRQAEANLREIRES